MRNLVQSRTISQRNQKNKIKNASRVHIFVQVHKLKREVRRDIVCATPKAR